MATCLSGASPCDHFRATGRACHVCQGAEDSYKATAVNKAVADAVRLLKYHGWHLSPPSQHAEHHP